MPCHNTTFSIGLLNLYSSGSSGNGLIPCHNTTFSIGLLSRHSSDLQVMGCSPAILQHFYLVTQSVLIRPLGNGLLPYHNTTFSYRSLSRYSSDLRMTGCSPTIIQYNIFNWVAQSILIRLSGNMLLPYHNTTFSIGFLS